MIKPFREVYDCDSITLDITNDCNFKCTYCFEKGKSKKYMPNKVAVDAMALAYNDLSKLNRKFQVNFFGGEPLLNWDCIKAVIYDNNKHHRLVDYGMTTNLSFLPKDFIQYVDDNSVGLLVSIDGVKHVHDKNRSNSWNQVVKNLKILITNGLKVLIEARMTVTPEDAKYMYDGVDFLVNELGLDSICPMPVYDMEWAEEQLNDYKENYIKIVDMYIDKLNDENSKRNVAIKNVDDFIRQVMEPEVSDDLLCPVGLNKWCTIDYNGDVYPCHQLPTASEEIKADQKIGNIYTGVDDTKVHTDRKEKQAVYSKEECLTCKAKGNCKNGCPEENLRENGDENKVLDSYCNLHKIMTEVITDKQNEILNATNIRSRYLNLIKCNLEIKNYLDMIMDTADLSNTFALKLRLIHLQEMINNLGANNIFPTFEEYFRKKMEILMTMILYALNSKGGVEDNGEISK